MYSIDEPVEAMPEEERSIALLRIVTFTINVHFLVLRILTNRWEYSFITFCAGVNGPAIMVPYGTTNEVWECCFFAGKQIARRG